jgi:proteasome lid subunit RPN8/RPN11
MPYPQLILSTAQWQAMQTHVAAAAPEEACGLLGGRAGRVGAVTAIENQLHSPTEFLMEPAAQVQALLAFEQAGLELVGIYHSHPAGPPHPSPTDVARAYYPEAIMLIWSPDEHNSWQARGFYLQTDAVTPVPLRVEEEEVAHGDR